MKFRNSTLVILFASLLFMACQQAAEDKVATVAEEKLAVVEMKVDGMVCAMGCAKFIEDKVAEQEGIKESKVDFKEGIAYFSYDENIISAEELEKFIDEIHDGQYDATILTEEEKVARESDEELESDELDDETVTEEKPEVAQVVNKIRNISFPELLTYFMKRL